MRAMAMVVLAVLAGCSRPAPERTAAAPGPRATPAPAIPASLQGRWAIAPADCDAKGDVRGLLTIGGDAFAFGVTPRTVDRVIVRPDRVAFDVTETDAGVAESRRYAFGRSPDGRRLTREDGPPANRVYTRCPERPS